MFRYALAVLAAVIAATFAATPVWATTSCSLSTSGLTFPSYDVFSTFVTMSTGSVRVQCSTVDPPGDTVKLTLSPGDSGSSANRKMINGSYHLAYNVYEGSTTTIFDDVTGISLSVPAGANYDSGNIAFEGQIPAGQNVPVGSYSDNLTFDLNF